MFLKLKFMPPNKCDKRYPKDSAYIHKAEENIPYYKTYLQIYKS